MVYTLHNTVIARVVGVGGDFSNTKKLLDDVRKLGADWRRLSERILRTHPQREMHRLIRTLLSAVTSTAVTASTSAR